MNQEKMIYRPPMESDSLIIQVTTGCAHNKCTFCTMYKDRRFGLMNLKEIFEQIELAGKYYKNVKKVFLADGDAFVLRSESMIAIIEKIKATFPECYHIASYARFTDVLRKSQAELNLLSQVGIAKLYLGLESGSDAVLNLVHKGSTTEMAIRASNMLREAGIEIYTTVLLGLGGKALSYEHIQETIHVLNIMNPDYISLMTLLTNDEMELMDDVRKGTFELLSPRELVMEARLLVEGLNVNKTILRINHASNFVNIEGHLPEDKNMILERINNALKTDLQSRDTLRRF